MMRCTNALLCRDTQYHFQKYSFYFAHNNNLQTTYELLSHCLDLFLFFILCNSHVLKFCFQLKRRDNSSKIGAYVELEYVNTQRLLKVIFNRIQLRLSAQRRSEIILWNTPLCSGCTHFAWFLLYIGTAASLLFVSGLLITESIKSTNTL